MECPKQRERRDLQLREVGTGSIPSLLTTQSRVGRSLAKTPRNNPELPTFCNRFGNISEVKVMTFGPSAAVSYYTFTYDAELQGKHRARTVICSDI